ncbi:MAG: MFS transporter [Alcaligenaceae bacterium]|nr:MAG: MFS transporter [Alcaligenaceae bacterium]
MSVAASEGPYTDPNEERASARSWIGLIVLAFAVLLISVDATVLDLALPAITADLTPTGTQLLWVIDVYSFVLAGLLITMGTLGDRIGRRRLLLIGAAGFGLASMLAAWSASPAMLIASRILQGISGATLMPATLGLIRSMFVNPRQRTTAIGVWGAMAGGGAAAGPLIGGWLLEHYWWGSVFLVNLPVMAALVVAGPLLIPEARDANPGRFDLPSAGLSILSMVPLVYAVKESAVHRPSMALAAIGAFGLVSGWLFVRRQRRLETPMIDLRLFARPTFTAAVLTNLLSVFALAGVVFVGSQYVQLVLGNSPLRAGMLMLPGTIVSIASSLLASWFVRRWQPGRVLSLGLLVSSVGAGTMGWIRTDGGARLFVFAFVLVGVGVGIALTLTSDLVVGSVEPERAGAASAVSETAYELGVALGVAILGSVVLSIYRSGLDISDISADDVHIAEETLGGAVALARSMPDTVGGMLLESARAAFIDGAHVASLVTAVILFANAVLVYWLMARR